MKWLKYLTVVMLLITTQTSFATECNFNVSLVQKNEFRVDAGFTPVDSPVTDGSFGINCGDLDIFIWGLHNNKSGKINEVDYGVGYSFKILKGLNGRIGLGIWDFKEAGTSNNVIIGNIAYSELPVTLGLKVIKIIDDDGTLITTSISKNLDIGNVGGFNLIFTPKAKFTYLDNFFGVTGHSNDVYSLSLNWKKDKFSINMFGNVHDGHNFSDSTQFGVGVGYSFGYWDI